MTITPIASVNVNWPGLMQAVQREQGRHVTATLDRADIKPGPGLPYLATISNIEREKPYAQSIDDPRLFNHLFYTFYFSLHHETVKFLAVTTRLHFIVYQKDRSDQDVGIMSGTLAQWIQGAKMAFDHNHFPDLKNFGVGVYRTFATEFGRFFPEELRKHG